MNADATTHANRIAGNIAESRGAKNLKLTGEGTEFLFYSAENGRHLEGYRVPKSQVFETINNPGVRASALQHKEMMLCRWAAENGIPSARPLGLIEQDRMPVLITEVVGDDGSEIDAESIGGLLADMHRLTPPYSMRNEAENQGIYVHVATRMIQRHERLGAKVPLPMLPSQEKITELLKRSLFRLSLLHMDIRRQNIRSWNRRPRALFDWSNALVAAPELEMARIEEYAAIPENGLDYPQIRAGYFNNGGALDEKSTVWNLLRLDAALMLAGVFSQVARNANLEQVFIERIRMLSEKIQF